MHNLQALYDRLPDGPMPARGSKAWGAWCEGLQSAMVGAFAEVHESYACQGYSSGCTATAVLQVGCLRRCVAGSLPDQFLTSLPAALVVPPAEVEVRRVRIARATHQVPAHMWRAGRVTSARGPAWLM